MQKWIVRLLETDGLEAEWMPLTAASEQAPERGDLAMAAQSLAGHSVVLVLPASMVTLHKVALPAASRARLREAAPYALEDLLADDVERLHFAVGERDSEGRIAVAVVERELLGTIVDQFSAAGIQISRIVSEALLLPKPEAGAVVLIETQRVIVRSGEVEGFGLESATWLELLGDELPQPVTAYYTGSPPEGILSQIEAVHCESALALLSQGVSKSPLDLRQGEFSPGEALGRSLRRWRATAVLATLLVAVWAAVVSVDTLRMEREAADLQADVESTLRQVFPDIKRIVNARTQMRQRLSALQDSGEQQAGFLDLLATVSEVLQSESGLDLAAISYRRGKLDLDLKATEIAALYRFQQKLAADSGLQVSVQSANSEQGQAQGRLRIEAKSG